MKRLVFGVLLFCAWGAALYANPAPAAFLPISFSEEILYFELTETAWKVRGIYTFNNNNDFETRGLIQYPVSDFVWTEGRYPRKLNERREVQIFVKQLEPEEKPLGDQPQSSSRHIVIPVLEWGKAVVEISYTLPIPTEPDEYSLSRIPPGLINNLLKTPKVTYFVTTAQSWIRPMDKAKFVLKVDEGIKIKEVSFSGAELTVEDGKQVYTWEFYDFMPNTDFIVDYEVIK